MTFSPESHLLLGLKRLAIRSGSCSIDVENHFGPQVSGCQNNFDFTLVFEETILALPITGLILFAVVPRILDLRKRGKKVESSALYITKLLGLAVIAVLQLVLLALWALPSAKTTQTTIGTAALSFVASTTLCFLSHFEHTRTIRPSSYLNVFLFLSTILDLPRARTLYFIDGNKNVAITFTVLVVLRALLIIPESTSKVGLLKEPYKQSSTEGTSGIFGQSLFLWLNPLLKHGNRAVLSLDDLPALEEPLLSSGTGEIGLKKYWEEISKRRTKHSLLLASSRYYIWPILAGIIPRAMQIGFTFAQPFLVDATVNLIEAGKDPSLDSDGYGLMAAFGLVYIGIAITTAVAQHKAYKLASMMRASLVDMIYSKTMVMLATNIEESAPVTLMSADIERVSSGLRYIHDAWACVVEIPIALWLLWNQLGVASVAQIGVAIVCMILALGVSALAGSRQKSWLEAIEKRVDATARMLGSMKGVKMTGLTDRLSSIIQTLRNDEIKESQKFRELLILVVALAYTNTSISPVVSFTIYSVISRSKGTEGLTTAKAFTSLTLFTLLATPISNIVEAAAGLATAIGSLERINCFLLSETRDDDRLDEPGCGDDSQEHLLKLPPGTISGGNIKEIELDLQTRGTEKDFAIRARELQTRGIEKDFSIRAQGRSAGWNKEKPTVVADLDFEIHPSTLTILVGLVGCGKSTFVNALLGETPLFDGRLQVSHTAIAYCSQTPWLTNKTLQENILGESIYEMDWYNTVIRACALESDIKSMPQGDQSMLGSQGAVLSGGQKQRLALARAVYSRIDMIILDDVLSGLDPTTEDHIFRALLGENGILRKNGVTVIMTTNSLQRLPAADLIIAIGADGRIMEQGSFQELNSRPGYIQSLSIEENTATIDKVDKPEIAQLPLSNPAEEPMQEGDRRTGDMTVYWYYFKIIGIWRALAFVALMFCYVFFISFPSIWVQWWAASNNSDPNNDLGYWLGIYAFLGIMAVIFIVLSCWHLMANLVSHAARTLHLKLLNGVLDAPMSFFSLTDVGKTTNRFSQDLQLIDMELPLALLNTVLALLTCVAQLIIVCVSTTYIAATIPACIVAFYFVQRYYLRTSRQLRFMDIEAKSPLFSNFLETLEGLTTIRSYGWEEQYRLRNSKLINSSQKPFYLLFCIQRWLELVIGLTVAGFAVVLVSVAVATRGSLGAGFIGVALLNIVTFSENLQGLIIHWTVLETSIGAVARIRNFTSTVESEHLSEEKQTPPDDWPSQGGIEFKDVVASYQTSSNPVLNGISFSAAGGQKIGICGSTGSGKSSLVSMLFRLLEFDSGSILIDGIDISTVPRQETRSRLIAIPQEPYLFQGSVRLNLDPSEVISDEDIADALRKVQLWDVVQSQGGLNASVTTELFSHGQRQLVCLAKAMLRKGKILVLDEATSSVDTKTDEVMQSLIRSEFKNHTVIAIAHRLDTILDFDQVLVVNKGRIIERGNPKELLSGPSSFRDLYMDMNHKES
ncbi:MAG: hypothetical protein M1818_000502 [Claussenomyces sp. TS43310]|nr:MAG: hypothetical protein M1818_000502 [Claussenomyces sp. TS43310]